MSFLGFLWDYNIAPWFLVGLRSVRLGFGCFRVPGVWVLGDFAVLVWLRFLGTIALCGFVVVHVGWICGFRHWFRLCFWFLWVWILV